MTGLGKCCSVADILTIEHYTSNHNVKFYKLFMDFRNKLNKNNSQISHFDNQPH